MTRIWTVLPALALALLAAPALADPVALECTSTSHSFDCAAGPGSGSAPPPVASGIYLLADHAFQTAVAAGVCPPHGTCVSIGPLDGTEHTDPATGERTYTGRITVLP